MKTKFNEVASSWFVKAVGVALVAVVLLPVVCLGKPIDMGGLELKDGFYYLRGKDLPYSGEYERYEGEDFYVIGKMKNGVIIEEKRQDFYGLSVQSYKDGKPYGVAKYLDKNGKLRQGDGKFTFPSGIKGVANYKNGLMQYMKLFSEDGKLYSITNYKDGVISEEKKFYDYEKGKLLMVMNYKDGELHGENKSFYENGNLGTVQNYKDGKPHGEWKSFYENGKLQSVANYNEGILLEMKMYDENGNLIQSQ